MRRAIALLFTLFFLMLMSVAVATALRNYNEARSVVAKQKLMLQSAMTLEDILFMLRTSPQLDEILKSKDPVALYLFLSQTAVIPLEYKQFHAILSIKSARGRYNINNLVDNRQKVRTAELEAVRHYLGAHELRAELVYYFVDCMWGIREDMSYYTDIFIANPELFRDYIASRRHMEQILQHYAVTYADNVFSKLDFDTLFLYEPRHDVAIDLNYATPAVWELLLGCSPQRARQLAQNAGSYTSVEGIGLNKSEKERLGRFKTSTFEPVLQVDIRMWNDYGDIYIGFEYDMKTKKVSNFVYRV